jgi:hypothetical protein
LSPVLGYKRGLARHPEGLPTFQYAWLEAPLAARLARLEEAGDWADFEAWPAGRVFGEEGEYRWQRLGDGTLHGVLLLESAVLPAGFEGQVSLTPGEEARFVLWGEWVNPKGDPEGNPDGGPSFYAQEIPEIQRYPIDLNEAPKPGAIPRLRVRRYRDAEGTRGDFIRCVGLELTPGGEHDS